MALGKIVLEEVRAGAWNAEVEFSTGVGARLHASSFEEMLKLLGREYKHLIARQSGRESALIRKASTAPERPAPEPTFATIQRAQEEAGLMDEGKQIGRKIRRAARAETHFANPAPAPVESQQPRQTRRSA